jgi:hypothetical protein
MLKGDITWIILKINAKYNRKQIKKINKAQSSIK